MPQVQIPREFFVKERKQAYGNWRVAFWRELFQNSWDAGCENVVIYAAQNGDDAPVVVKFADDGPGMARETLTDVYFSLGKSTKDGTTAAGGFGRARILTCFSMKSYVIRTNNSLVVGEGSSYEITDLDPPEDGCTLNIEIDDETRNSMLNGLGAYLTECSCPSKVWINGEQWERDYAKGDWIRDLKLDDHTFAKVYYNKTDPHISNRTVIRVNGISMFNRYTSVNGKITVELDPTRSREILTSNRDGLHSGYAEVLRKFESELSSESETALRPKHVEELRIFSGKGMVVTARQPKMGIDATPEGMASLARMAAKMARDNPGTSQKVVITTPTGGKMIVTKPQERSVAEFIATVPILVETGDDKLLKMAERFDPHHWKFELSGDVVRWVGGCENYVKQYLMWKIACEHAVKAALKLEWDDQIKWAAGFYFGPDQAKNMEYGGGYALMLNPVDDDGKLKFSIREKSDLKKMMAKAKHEVAHCFERYHNETYAMALTEIDGYFDEWKCLSDMVTAK